MRLHPALGAAAAAVLVLALAAGGPATLTLISAPAETDTAAPPLRQTGWVTDAADVIPEPAEQRIAAKLAKLERTTLHQVVLVTVPALDGRDIADVADELGNTWGVGRAGYNDGAVILVAPNDRRVRISTADGLRLLLPDEACHRIIQDAMIPHFRKGEIAAGSEAGVGAIIAHFTRQAQESGPGQPPTSWR